MGGRDFDTWPDECRNSPGIAQQKTWPLAVLHVFSIVSAGIFHDFEFVCKGPISLTQILPKL